VARTKKSVKTDAQGKAKTAQKNGMSKASVKRAGEAVTVNGRDGSDRRGGGDRRVSGVPVAVERRKLTRRVKINRRRQIDPTTCERNYSVEEIEFMGALDSYKRTSGRMFPTCSEILEVLRGLGYEKRPTVPTVPEIASGSAGAIPTYEEPLSSEALVG